MPKISLLEDSEDELSYTFYCAGCRCSHFITIRRDGYTRNDPRRPDELALWTLTGTFDKPTVTPSIDVFRHNPNLRCHSLIKDGMIQYLPDSHHHLKGTTVEMEEDD